jgi:hypothetical protein
MRATQCPDFSFNFMGWSEAESTWYFGQCLAYCTNPEWKMMSVEQSVEWKIGRRNRSTRRKPAPMPLCPTQIPHKLTWDRTQSAAVVSQRLTAGTISRPVSWLGQRKWLNKSTTARLMLCSLSANKLRMNSKVDMGETVRWTSNHGQGQELVLHLAGGGGCLGESNNFST